VTPPWWMAVPAVSTTVTCRGEQHRIRWEAGALLADDHDDAEAEETLRALGGQPPECLRLQNRWAACSGDVVLLTLGRRPGEAGLGLAPDLVASLLEVLEPAGPRRYATVPGAAVAEPKLAAAARRAALLALFSLPVAFIDRLVLTAFAHAAAHWSDEAFRSAHGLRLGAALTARATPALRRLGERLHTPVEVLCAPATPGDPGTVRAELSGQVLVVKAELSPWWLPAVWGAGISEPSGGFVLRVTGADDAAISVERAEWEPAGSRSWVAAARSERLSWDSQGLLRSHPERYGS
jgi:hypothetical protein